jgi:hypothetical protein
VIYSSKGLRISDVGQRKPGCVAKIPVRLLMKMNNPWNLILVGGGTLVIFLITTEFVFLMH